ncbi:MAG: hypothetical protein K8S15_08565 [Candidatus Aegiribacteria sp.]|nr:hypothetical protein [Candidatus Aegiribacteria sp.]
MTVYLNSTVSAIDGYIGNYLTSIESSDTGETEEYEHGIIVITTGAVEMTPDSYLYGDENVLKQLELKRVLEENEKEYSKLKSVVMIQCVGSRDDDHPYCSRVCCTQAVKNAIRLKELNQKLNVYILYRDIRTYGFNEEYLQQARNMGVIFIRYEDDNKPIVKYVKDGENKKIAVSVRDHVLDTDIEIAPDRIILASAMEPQKDAERLSQMLKIPLNEDRFFMEAHVNLRPLDFSLVNL